VKRTPILALLLVLAACATTPQGRELQTAKAIQGVNDNAVVALNFDIISADEGEAVQAATRTMTRDLKRAIAARRAGEPLEAWERIMLGIQDALKEASRILEGRE
jgi:hypothetical protein